MKRIIKNIINRFVYNNYFAKLPPSLLPHLPMHNISEKERIKLQHCELSIQSMSNRISRDALQSPPAKCDLFEDLAFLFFNSIANRGFIRLDFDEAALLYRFARQVQSGHILEIGRFNGGSTILLCLACGLDTIVHSIDISPRDDDYLTKFLRQQGVAEKADLHIADSTKFESSWPLDILFIDGDHSYEGVKKDFLQWKDAVKSGGVAIFHDAVMSRPNCNVVIGVHQFMQEIRNLPDWNEVAVAGSMMVWQKK